MTAHMEGAMLERILDNGPLAAWLGRKPWHPALRASRERFRRFDQGLSLEEYEFTVVDTELTGMDHRKDEIVSIGAVRIRGMAIAPGENFYAVVRPSCLPKACTLIHRITPSEVEAAPDLADVLPEFADYLGQSLVVGHHIGMDMAFINRASRGILGGPMVNPCLDTLRLAQVHEEERRMDHDDRFNPRLSYTLADLSGQYGLPRFPAHNALSDAMQTACLFLFLARKLRKGCLRTLKELHALSRDWRWRL